jgi:hypothetical protein
MSKERVVKPSRREVIAGVRRVLRLTDGYLSHFNQEYLMGHGGGIMTVAELRQHIKAALKFSAALARKTKVAKRKQQQGD